LALGSENAAHRASADTASIPIIDNQNETVSKTWLNNKNSVLMVDLRMWTIEKIDVELAKRTIIDLSEIPLNQMELGAVRFLPSQCLPRNSLWCLGIATNQSFCVQ
jgi:hypothetical protein